MADTPFDVIIVGQGIAGTTLAWHLREAGKRVLVIDASEPVTSSKIAAGLITPITGQRLALSPQFDEVMQAARTFYALVEKRTGRSFFHDRTALRLFQSEAERQAWAEREGLADYQAHLVSPQPAPLLDPELGDTGAGGFAMQAAQLDVPAYLEASRTVLACETMQLDWQRDVTFSPESVSVKGFQTRLLISCEGFAAARNPWLTCVPFNAAKGDILTVCFHRPVPAQSLHRGIWLAPTAEPDVFSVGATYDWARLDQEPDPVARAEIERKLKTFFHVPYTVLDHRAAVRPILAANRVLAGLHGQEERLGFFNGLGSKGSLLAPFYAQCLTDFLVDNVPLPEAMDIRRYLEP
jgi:glycine/D-amino acid oxidase-like deaminating enzyme